MGFAKLRLQSYGSLVFGVTSQSPFPMWRNSAPLRLATSARRIPSARWLREASHILRIGKIPQDEQAHLGNFANPPSRCLQFYKNS